MANVTELQKRIWNIVAQEVDGPVAGTDDWDLNLSYLNTAQHEWSESYGWESLLKISNSMTSQSTGNVTMALPSDFRKLNGFVEIIDGGNLHKYPLNPIETNYQRDSSDYQINIMGYPENYKMIVNPMPGSGASISYTYWAEPASLASPNDISMCSDPQFLVQRAISYLWEARDDGRFLEARAEGDKILARMLEYQMAKGESSDTRIKTYEGTKGFRIGRS